MNSFILMAQIIKEPELRYTQDTQVPLSQMLVQFPALKAEDTPATLRVIGFGGLATEIQENFHEGDQVILQGELNINSIDRPEGFKEKRPELKISKIYKVGEATGFADLPRSNPAVSPVSGTTTNTNSYTPTAPKASTPEPDLDDIPF
ncbi:MAG: single-stranded DNA-binding protein [Coleofasciculaceae cyanobacterium SM2_1_6]|nr:single-stranded DNA-binding protein [Coleofasciculaceae cyanobacterium SM2_1_6]